MLASFLSGWLHFYGGNFSYSYTSRAVFNYFILYFIFYLGSSSYTSHACFFLFYLGCFSYASCAGFFFFIGGVSLTHFVLAAYLSGEFLLHIPCWLHFSIGSFYGEFLLNIPCWLHFFLESFSYTSHALFFFLSFFLSFLSGEFLLHISWMCLPYQLLIKKESVFFFSLSVGVSSWKKKINNQ